MTDRPILFSAPMVRALLAGTKTQTRRIMPDQSLLRDGPDGYEIWTGFMGWETVEWALANRGACGKGVLPRIAASDRLWVRESGHLLREAYEHDPVMKEDVWRDAAFRHSADNTIVPIRPYDPPIEDWVDDCSQKSRPSIYMPRWASRLTLLVTDVRIERLQNISGSDAIAEGADITSEQTMTGPMVKVAPGTYLSPVAWYHRLWDDINGAGAWDANPWIVAYSFRCIPKNIDSLTGAE